jgi:hypothetical protein
VRTGALKKGGTGDAKEHETLVALLQESMKVENDQAIKLAAAIEELIDAKLASAFDARERPDYR